MSRQQVQVNIRISVETKRRLVAVAEAERRSMADQADILLTRALDGWDRAHARRDGK